MATIVRHKETGEIFAVVGSGYSAHWSNIGVWRNNYKRQSSEFRLAVCSEDGHLQHIGAQSVEVVSIDGQPIAELFSRKSAYRGA